jgi:hypothetical protein
VRKESENGESNSKNTRLPRSPSDAIKTFREAAEYKMRILLFYAALLSSCVLLPGLLLCNACPVYAQDTTRVIEIENAVRQSMSENPKSTAPLLITRDLNLKEDFIAVQMPMSKFSERRVMLVDFYEVHTGVYFMDGDKVKGEYFELGEDRFWLIGFGPTNSQYLLAGFDDPVRGFNNLIRDLNVGTVTQDTVRDVFDLFLKTAFGNQFRTSLVADEMHLQALAVEDFRLRFASTRRKSEFDKWWMRLPRALKKSLSVPRVSSDAGGFKIDYFQYHLGRVLQETVFVRSNGTVVLGNTVVRYPKPLTKNG